MPKRDPAPAPPPTFELLTGDRTMRYAARGGVVAAASTFGGRWRVTAPSGDPIFSLAPAGAPGTDDREVVPHGCSPVATILRDRRRGDSWIVLAPGGNIVLRATLTGPYELALTDREGAVTGKLFATATSVVTEFAATASDPHHLALALPLYFATTGALRVASLDAPTPDLALWGTG